MRRLWASLRGGASDLPATGPAAKRRAWSIDDPAARRRASLHYHLLDHAILRYGWTNMHQIAPGVWRSNHPTHGRLAAVAGLGIRTILNLRGTDETPAHLFEVESCRALGLRLVSVKLSARSAPRRDELLRLLEAFRTVERPFLMHCKSGADRAGLASALYVLAHGGSIAEARRQLHWRFLHVRASRTGILDHVLDLYEARQARGPLGIEDWVRDEYDREAATASFGR